MALLVSTIVSATFISAIGLMRGCALGIEGLKMSYRFYLFRLLVYVYHLVVVSNFILSFYFEFHYSCRYNLTYYSN